MATGLSSVNATAPSPFPNLSTNKILASLPAGEFSDIAQHLRRVPLRARQICHKQGETIRAIYFPGGGACSLTKVMRDGRTAEIATIGSEGLIGAGVFFGDESSHGDVIAYVADPYAVCMEAGAFVEEMHRRRAFYNRVVRYSQTLATQIVQTTACNGLHSVKERYCRWLLMALDRIGGLELKVTQDFVAAMLGVRRPTVTLLAAELEAGGIIRAHRGSITVVDRRNLEATCCECYASVQANFRRMLPEISQ
ncbi:MAG: Crp/Fnr family transcriptional regulator [Vicinamibacterales bacterium]